MENYAQTVTRLDWKKKEILIIIFLFIFFYLSSMETASEAFGVVRVITGDITVWVREIKKFTIFSRPKYF